MKKVYTTILGLLIIATLSAMSFRSIIVDAKNPESDKLQLVAAGRMDQPAISAPGIVTIDAAGRGNPHINFLDAQSLPAANAGGKSEIRNPQSEIPTALAAADFDEDGVPDLVSAHTAESHGFLTLYRGNVDSIYPNSAEAQQRRAAGRYTESPFLPETRIFEVPVTPDLMGTGDLRRWSHRSFTGGARRHCTLQTTWRRSRKFSPARDVLLARQHHRDEHRRAQHKSCARGRGRHRGI